MRAQLLVLCGLTLSSVASAQVEINVGATATPAGTAMGKGQMRKAPTREEVMEKKAAAPKAYQTPGFQKQGEAPISLPAQPSLLASSLLINDGKRWTVLPRGAVLRFADEVKPHIKEGKAGDLVSWQQFQAANSAWIRSVPLHEGQISGKVPFTDEIKKQWQDSKVLLVSTFQNNPISLPPPPKTPDSVQANSNPTKP